MRRVLHKTLKANIEDIDTELEKILEEYDTLRGSDHPFSFSFFANLNDSFRHQPSESVVSLMAMAISMENNATQRHQLIISANANMNRMTAKMLGEISLVRFSDISCINRKTSQFF